MRTIARFAVIAVAVIAIAYSSRAQGPGAHPDLTGKTAAQAYKNIQVLKDIPADQLIPSMQFISTSLGVRCDYCHVDRDFDKDDKKPKQTARQMMQMMFAIDKDNFAGRKEVTCFTCHRGKAEAVSTPLVASVENAPERPSTAGPGGPPPGAPANAAETKPPAQQSADPIIERYVQAIGAAGAQRVSSLAEKGTLTGFGPQPLPVEVYSKAPDKRIAIVHLPNGGEMITAFDGRSGWLGSAGQPPHEMSPAENDGARLDAQVFLGADLKQVFPHMRVVRPEEVDGKEANVVLAFYQQGKPPVRLYFDKDSGLLVRMVRVQETALGNLPTEVDFADYRTEGGVKMPSRWSVARPNGRFTIQIADVQQNVPIADSKFEKPASPQQPAQ
jgi:hypothetical protein